MKTVLAIALAFVSAAAWTGKRAPANASASRLVFVTVTYGEKVTELTVRSGAVYSLSIRANDGLERSTEIQKEDADYLVSKMAAVPESLDHPSGCNRQWAYAEALVPNKPKRRVSACLENGGQAAKDLVALANLMSTLL
jgi:hypothetical protein